MKNKKRHPDYIKLKQKIESATEKNLESYRQVVVKFVHEHMGTDDATDLNLLFLQKRDEVTPNFYQP